MFHLTLVSDNFDPRDHDPVFQAALRTRRQAITEAIFIKSQLGSRQLRAELPEYAPQVSRLLAAYLEATVMDATLSAKVYAWLAGRVLQAMTDWKIYDPGYGAVGLVEDLIRCGDGPRIEATVKGVNALFPEFEPDYRAYMAKFTADLMAEHNLEAGSYNYQVITQAMMLVWLTLRAGDDHQGNYNHPGSHEPPVCPQMGGLKLVTG